MTPENSERLQTTPNESSGTSGSELTVLGSGLTTVRVGWEWLVRSSESTPLSQTPARSFETRFLLNFLLEFLCACVRVCVCVWNADWQASTYQAPKSFTVDDLPQLSSKLLWEPASNEPSSSGWSLRNCVWLRVKH